MKALALDPGGLCGFAAGELGVARFACCAKMKRRPLPAGASGSMRHAPSQALAEDYRDSDRQDQDRPLISEDGQPGLRRVGLPRSRP